MMDDLEEVYLEAFFIVKEIINILSVDVSKKVFLFYLFMVELEAGFVTMNQKLGIDKCYFDDIKCFE